MDTLLPDQQILEEVIEEVMGTRELGTAVIRDTKPINERLATRMIEAGHPGFEMSNLGMGIPGINPPNALLQIQSQYVLDGSRIKNYPDFDGSAYFRQIMQDFMQHAYGSKVQSFATAGAMQAGALAHHLIKQMFPENPKMLYVVPGFEVSISQQPAKYGIEPVLLDVMDEEGRISRGQELIDRIEKAVVDSGMAKTGGGILFSNPTNPTNMIYTSEELKGIAAIIDKYGLVGFEDGAYSLIHTDIRHGQIETILNHTENAAYLFSGTKSHSTAGNRIGSFNASQTFFQKEVNRTNLFTLIKGGSFPETAGVNWVAMDALAHILDLEIKGEFSTYDFTEPYRRFGGELLKIFQQNGFHTVYPVDQSGFYFTVGRGDSNTTQLMRGLLDVGIVAVPLNSSGVNRDAVRISTSQTLTPEALNTVKQRLEYFGKT